MKSKYLVYVTQLKTDWCRVRQMELTDEQANEFRESIGKPAKGYKVVKIEAVERDV